MSRAADGKPAQPDTWTWPGGALASHRREGPRGALAQARLVAGAERAARWPFPSTPTTRP